MDRPDNLPELTERLRQNMGRPVLSPAQAGIYDSGYVEDFDAALELLEEAEQIKPGYPGKPFY